VLPTTMKEMASVYAGGGGGNGGARYKVIEGAGHLPMVERPREFTDFVEGFLDG
jgi:pimeloyl-ACP methyl ester carboxylesterase